jgi:hypothetical protein
MVQPRPAGDDDLPEPPRVRRLRLLVSLLTVVLIGGMVVVAAAMVIRLGDLGGAPKLAPITAAGLTLPSGAEVMAVGQGGAGVLILTRDASGAETLRVFDPASGAQVSATPITRE